MTMHAIGTLVRTAAGAARHGWILAVAGALITLVLLTATAHAHYGYARSPMASTTTVTSTWSHAQGYGERALDLSGSGVSVYSNLQNPNSSDYLYYEVYNYQGTSSCPGSKFNLYRHSGGAYYYYGTINFVHLGDHTSLWGRSVDIAPGQSETWLYVGYTVDSCGSAAHLHYGHLGNDGLIEYINPSLWSTIAPSQLILYY